MTQQQGNYTIEDYYALPDDRTMVQPDIIIICSKNRTLIRRWGIMSPPDFIAEILPPSTRKKDTGLKLIKYANAGVWEYWILEPDKQKLIVYDFKHYELPAVHGLQGKAPVHIFHGELEIALDNIRNVIREYPES